MRNEELQMRNGKKAETGLKATRNPPCLCAPVRGYFLVYLLKGIRNEKGEIKNEE